jgi:hypothetical protein
VKKKAPPAAKPKPPKAKKPLGRPSKYTPALCDEICERLRKGEPLAVICRDEGMPHPSTFRQWAETRPDLTLAIARAREDGFDAIAAECLDIANDGLRDYGLGVNGGIFVDHDHIQRSKLRVETRLKLLAKWDPKRYGDKLQHADADGNALPPMNLVIQPVEPPKRGD